MLSYLNACIVIYCFAKNITAYGIAAIAHNLRKGAKFLSLYGLLDLNYAG